MKKNTFDSICSIVGMSCRIMRGRSRQRVSGLDNRCCFTYFRSKFGIKIGRFCTSTF